MGIAVVWRDIAGYEGLYKVSNMGDIYSTYYNRLLKPQKNSQTGYLQVFLCKSPTEHKSYSVHRLVAKAFVDGYKDGLMINHKNKIRDDNRATNLEWCTCKYNNNYGNKTDVYCKKVYQYSLDGKFIKEWRSTHDVDRALQISYKNVSAVCRFKRKSAGGFIWRYEKEVNNL